MSENKRLMATNAHSEHLLLAWMHAPCMRQCAAVLTASL